MLNKLGKEVLIFDGAMGTTLQNEGIKIGQIPEELNIEKSEIIKKIHKKYIDAGADIITTNTFGANKYKLSLSKYSVKEVIEKAIENAKAVTKDNLIALDIGPIGKALKPIGELEFEEAYDYFKEQVIYGKSGVDLVLIETISSILEAKAAILAVKENSDLPVFVTMTIDEKNRTLNGSDVKNLAVVLSSLNVDCIGLNCSMGPYQMIEPIKEVVKYSKVPVMIQPNAGLPKIKDGETIFDYSVEKYFNDMKEILNSGVSVIGGCCGTTYDYIKKISEFKGNKVIETDYIKGSFVCSGSKMVEIGKNKKIIGERINPTGKKRLKKAILNNDLNYILREGLNQVNSGAEVLDVNIGLPDINEIEFYKKLIPEMQAVTNTPLQIDSASVDAIEAAIRVYEGRPIINSVNGKESSMEKILPLAKKYGALVVALTLDEAGLPKGVEGRVKIAEKIIKRSLEYGLSEEDIIVDCITLSVSTNQKDALETLEAIETLKEKYNIKTTLGASNVSFGLPNRNFINTTFLTMALLKGLDIPITDPTNVDIRATFRAFKILNNEKDSIEEYIEDFSGFKKEEKVEKHENTLIDMIIKGFKSQAGDKTKELLINLEPLDIVNNHLIKALDVVSDKYEKEEIFLPQLIRSAETVKESFKVIKDTFDMDHEISKGKVILATVEGDIHDIGKNIVKVLLENYGFDVIDLGKDVKKELVVDAIKKYDVKLVGLSALMTTTVINMKETISLIKENNLDCKIVVGGAVLNEEYAEMVGADFYASDAKETVNIANNIFKN